MNAAFAADTAAIFAGPLATDGLYKVGGAGIGTDIRAICSLPDMVADFGTARFASETAVFLVPVASVADPAEGDELEFSFGSFAVQGSPQRDPRRLWWRIEARAI